MMTSSSHFLGFYYFWGSGVRQKYAVQVLVGCGIKFRVQRSLPLKILSKNTRRYVENTNKKSSFFLSSSKINKYYFIIFLRRTILDLKFPLMFMVQFIQNRAMNIFLFILLYEPKALHRLVHLILTKIFLPKLMTRLVYFLISIPKALELAFQG